MKQLTNKNSYKNSGMLHCRKVKFRIIQGLGMQLIYKNNIFKVAYKYILCIYVLYAFGCKNYNTHQLTDHEKLKIAFQYADTNSKELKKVINFYSENPKDSLKLKAAYFLIENMIGKGYYKLTKYTTNGVQCDFDVFNPKFDFINGIDSINKLKKKYEDSAKCGVIFYANPQFVEDIKTVSSEYLIENIEFAFKAWKMPWAKKLTFEQFKEFILPYRFGNEPLQNWRKEMFEKGSWIYQ